MSRQDVPSEWLKPVPRNAGGRVDGWVDVKDRLPEPSEWYLVTGDVIYDRRSENVTIAFLSKIDDKWYDIVFRGPLDVTHWMPLPSAPNEI
jgi:hypothetical protein